MRIFFVLASLLFATASFAADLKVRADTENQGKDNTATLPKNRPVGNPPTQEDIDSLPKTTVNSKDNHEAPPEQGTTVEQPK